MCFSGLYCAVLACTGLDLSIVDCIGLYLALLYCTLAHEKAGILEYEAPIKVYLEQLLNTFFILMSFS